MNLRRIITVGLLLAAGAALAASVVKHVRGGGSASPDRPADVPADGEAAIVYYFHATIRCVSCNQAESAVQELMTNEFADEVKAGRLQLRVVDFQDEAALAAHYKVAGPTVVVARFKDGKELEPYILDKALELADRPGDLRGYLVNGIRQGAPRSDLPRVLWVAMIAAFGMGLLTAISPCPMATNVAAISFLGRQAARPRKVLLSGLAYTAGRMTVYVVLGVVIIYFLQQRWGEAGGASVSRFLQAYGGMIIGPVLIVVGLVLLGLISSARSINLAGQRLQQRASGGGVAWAFILGVLFALSFCPISATIFFGSMITLSAANQSPVLLPMTFGIATALPVIAFAFLIAFASRYVGVVFNRMVQIDRGLRLAAGWIFVASGMLYALAHLGVVSLGIG